MIKRVKQEDKEKSIKLERNVLASRTGIRPRACGDAGKWRGKLNLEVKYLNIEEKKKRKTV